MSASRLKKCLDDLEACGAQCVATGGIDPQADPKWQKLTQRLMKAHNRWAEPLGLPQLTGDIDNRATLLPWMRRQELNGRGAQWLAAILCHIEVARSLESWTDDVFEPLDPWWPQDPGPRLVRVPSAAWDVVIGRQVDPDWMLEPMADLLFFGFPFEEKNTKRPLDVHHEDTVRLLPGLVVARWMLTNFLTSRHAMDLSHRVSRLIEHSRSTTAAVERWDDGVHH